LDNVWPLLEQFFNATRSWQWHSAVDRLGDVFGAVAAGISSCSPAGDKLEQFARKIGITEAASAIGNAVQVMIDGGDVSLTLSQLVADVDDKSWSYVGSDFGMLADQLDKTGCTSFVCQIVHGLLSEAGCAFSAFEECMDDVHESEGSFTAGVASFKEGEVLHALRYWAAGLSHVAEGLHACDVEGHLGNLKQESNLFGFGNVTVGRAGELSKLIIHGFDFYELMYKSVDSMVHHDYYAAGDTLGQALDQMSDWTLGHMCTSPVCYSILGALQYLDAVQDDFQECKHDFRRVEQNISAAFDTLVDFKQKPLHFRRDLASLNAGLHAVSAAFSSVATLVSDCHLSELSEILLKIAKALSLPASIVWVGDVIHIAINGFSITREVVDMLKGFADANWPAVGFHWAKLSLLLRAEELVDFAERFPGLKASPRYHEAVAEMAAQSAQALVVV